MFPIQGVLTDVREPWVLFARLQAWLRIAGSQLRYRSRFVSRTHAERSVRWYIPDAEM